MTNTEKFFLDSDSDQLRRIYQWARARYAAPWAVFFAVLIRVAASVGPHVQLPGIIGGRASLNVLCAFVSASGGGKGISDKVGRLAWPTPILELPIGSGEGIAATFKKPDKEDENTVISAIFNVPEIDTLAGIASRQGSILLAQLKSMAMGEQLGQSNASKATSRIVKPHSYRCCLSIGAQPGHTGVIFNDTTGGTPQRLLWSPTTDPDMPAEASADPSPLDTTLPRWEPGEDGAVEIGYGIPEIAETVITAHIARQRGEADPLDGHRMLTRCKVAALLAIMHQRSKVSQWDWDRSADVMAVSDATREWIVNEAKKADRAKVRDRAMARAVGEEIIDGRRLDVVRRRILTVLSNGRTPRGDLRARLGKREYRELLDAAIAELTTEGLVRSIAVEQGTHFELAEFSPEPEFRPHIASSEALTREFSPEPAATITELDSRRSPETGRPKLSCQKWFDNHISELRAAGHTTAESFAVNRAGEAAGYTRANLSQAASAHPDVVAIDRTSRGATWSITGDRQSAYIPAPAFFAEYLSNLPAGATQIDQTDYQRASAAAGYGWEAAAKAATKHPRVESVPAAGNSRNDRIWLLKPEADQGAVS
ncbi:hypothetical protein NJB1604_02160 [Mycobacterium marinum]|uniref:hypothetical protein n=1 Tax=Mycobacterium marinum TaxID=1781 RepID=UPI0021C357A5|nr:hypothetical protein [Mycobacterium marinum]GJO37413.1 hypothetical protein NJB1604_02160 [Mycobacterium marinum]